MVKQSEVVTKHIVIDARIRPASTGKPVDRFLEYLPGYDKKNHYTVVLKNDDSWTSASNNIRVVKTRFPIFSLNPLNQLLYAIQLYRLRPDLVFFTLTGQQPILFFGKQITLTHDLTMYEYVRAGKLPVWAHQIRMIGYRFLMWSAHRKSKHIIVPSDYVLGALVRFHSFTKNKVTRVYESSEPESEITESPLRGISGQFILHVGSPLPHKNIENLLQAFEIVKESNKPLQLVLAGKKEYFMEELIRKHDLEKNKDVIIPGFVSDAELKWLYKHAACYVLPSLSEGFGLPGLEAMAHGCPLVSSDATCLPEIYGDAAEYFNPRDVEEIAKKINMVIGDGAMREKLTKLGLKRLEKYSWEKMTENFVQIIQKHTG
jgi:glycosyltransferase involved in cell wall biosynthesis